MCFDRVFLKPASGGTIKSYSCEEFRNGILSTVRKILSFSKMKPASGELNKSDIHINGI